MNAKETMSHPSPDTRNVVLFVALMIWGHGIGFSQTNPNLNIPAELLPCVQYEKTWLIPASIMPSMGLKKVAATVNDTFELRCGSQNLKFNAVASQSYSIRVPCQMGPSVCSIYTLDGKLYASNAVTIVNPNTQTLKASISSQSGKVRNSLRGWIEGQGLWFGSLPSSGSFVHQVRSISLRHSTDRIDFQIDSIPTPYKAYGRFDFNINLPPTSYDLHVERTDRATLVEAAAFRLDTVDAPRVDSVFPETLGLGTVTTLTLLGENMNFGYKTSTFTLVDGDKLKGVLLRHKDKVKEADEIPMLSESYLPPKIQNGFYASFIPPDDFPEGFADLGVIVAGRSDTAYSLNAVFLKKSQPSLRSFSPAVWGQGRLEAKIIMKDPPPGISRTEIRLIQGAQSVVGSLLDAQPTDTLIHVAFPFTFRSDTGDYDIQFRRGDEILFSRKGVLKILPPVMLQLGPNSGEQGSPKSSYLYTQYPLNGLKISDLQSYSLCQGAKCLSVSAVITDSISPQSTFQMNLTLPENASPGLYDFQSDLRGFPKSLNQKNAFLVFPKGALPLIPRSAAPIHDTAYWRFYANEENSPTFILPPYFCNITVNSPSQLPKGMAWKGNGFAWKPSLADTGTYLIDFTEREACAGKRYFVAIQVVSEKSVPILWPSRPPGKFDFSVTRLLPSPEPGVLRVETSQPVQLDLYTTRGRLISQFELNSPGQYSLRLPLLLSPGTLLFCRLRHDGLSAGGLWLTP